jgi:hypothetical protein
LIQHLPDHEDRVVTIERLFRGPSEVSAIYNVPSATHRGSVVRRLYQNGYSPIALNRGAESVIAVVGASYTKKHDRALVLGAGSGRTAGTAAQMFGKTDVLDIGVTVPALLDALVKENMGVLARPNVRYKELDAIHAPIAFEPGYDLIVLTVDPGYLPRSAKLYTLDFFRRIKTLLSEGGVFVFWTDASLDEEATQVLINTGRAAFSEQKVFSEGRLVQEGGGTVVTYLFLVHSDLPLSYDRAALGQLPTDDAESNALPLDSDRDRLVEGRFHPTTEIHTFARPSPRVLFGGFNSGTISFRAER